MKWSDIGFSNLKQSMYKIYDKRNFQVYNPGIAIHPFEQELKIIISKVVGSTSFFQLKNTTNDTVFRVNEAVEDSQIIVLDGINITNNGLPFLRHTNKKYIELAPGWNEFEITGSSRATIEFFFPFFYL